MKNKTITYDTLKQKLTGLGYTFRTAQANGDKAIVFEHKDLQGAMIILPEHRDTEVVDPFFLRKVLVILRSHGLVEEESPFLVGNEGR
jgi:hypothetical protein